MEILHFSHEHVLYLSERERENEIVCNGCIDYCVGPTYSCRESYCYFDLHDSCAKLPQELHNPLHPHPLALRPDYLQFNCHACDELSPGFSFSCDKCDVKLDLNCAFIRPALEETGEPVGTRLSQYHQHPLLLLQNMPADRINCRLCGTYCSDQTYGCFPCRFFLHPLCFEQNSPQLIFHPFHPYHGPLTLLEQTRIGCHACRKTKHARNRDREKKYERHNPLFTTSAAGSLNPYIKKIPSSFSYVCQANKCRFLLHTECRVIRPAITFDGHDHLLQFTDKIENIGDEPIKCRACNSTCESYGFSCLYCKFNLHLLCGPLPYTIKHKCHIDPLILTYSLAETDEELYCDACEEERDPLLPIYYCAECDFVAEISCVISEVILSLNGEYGDVDLRNSLGQFGKVITEDAAKEMAQKKENHHKSALIWRDVVCSLSEDERMVADLIANRIMETTMEEKIEPYDHEEIIIFSDKAYKHFIKFLNHSTFGNYRFRFLNFWILSYRAEEEVVDVGDYMTTRKLAPILNHLLSNHGDIGAESTLSPKLKSLYICMLCDCIDSMRNTMVMDITHDILLSWWTCLKTLHSAGFKIEFAFDHLKRVTHAHFGLYVEKEVGNVVDQLDRDIKKLTRKLERILSAKAAKSSFIEECLREASVLKKVKTVMSTLL